MKVPTRKREQLSLNSDHTHFIIIREQPVSANAKKAAESEASTNNTGGKQLEKLTDSAESLTNKFRDRFEEFLHQEVLQQPNSEVSPPATTRMNRNRYYFRKFLFLR